VLLAADVQAVSATELWEEIERVASRDKIASAIAAVDELAPFGEDDDDDADRRAELVKRYATVRPFLPMLSTVVPFGAGSGAGPARPFRRRDDGPLRLHDTTVRRHWEKARKVNARGEDVTIDPGGPLAEANWAKQRLGRAAQALPNGYRGLPVQKSCPHANACLTCPMFITTPEFLPQHHEHRQQVLQIITAAEARGQARLGEMNRQVLGNLDKIIVALEADPGPGRPEAADAS
jgi:hypothetical protein